MAPRRNDTASAAAEVEEEGGVAKDLFVVENKTKRNLSVQVGYIRDRFFIYQVLQQGKCLERR